MAFFWFIIVIVLLIIVSRRKPPEQGEDRYAQGYWDGFRSAGERIARQLERPEIDRQALQAIVDEGNGGQEEDAGAVESAYAAPSTALAEEPVAEAPVITVPTLTPAEQSLRNLNTMLYMASFLLVAAAAAFVAAAMPAGVRLGGLIVVVVLFYGVGMLLHAQVPRLRPAAVAFIGTGLAILPFVGVALHLLGGVPGAAAWFVISLIGLIAYAVAAIVLQSQVVSYLTMAFVLSLVSSAVATVSLPIVWYFIALIIVSLLANVVGFLWPRRLPAIFRLPVEQTGQIVTPLAVAASVFVAQQMTIRMYEVLFLVVSAHYLVVWLQQRRYWQLAVARGVLHVAFLVFAWDWTHGATDAFLAWWLVGAIIQAAISFVATHRHDVTAYQREQGWLLAVVGAIVVGSIWWLSGAHPALGATLSMSALGLVALVALWQFRRIGWAYLGLIASIVLVFVVTRWLASPAWPWSVAIGSFVALAAAGLGAYAWATVQRWSVAVTQLFGVATLVYAALIVISGLLARDAVTLGWSLMLTAAVLVAVSYVAREYLIEGVGAVLAVIALFVWIGQSSIDAGWQLTAAVGLSVGVLAAATVVHHLRGEAHRRTTLLVLGMFVLALLVGNISQPRRAVAIASLVVLLASAFAALVLRGMTRQAAAVFRPVSVGGYAGFMLLAWALSLALPIEWQVLVYAAAFVVLWASSYLERIPPLTIGGNVMLVVLLSHLWVWLRLDMTWTVFGVAWLAAGLIYGLYWLMAERADVWRQWACIGSVWVILGGAALMECFAYPTILQVAAAGSVVALGATMAVHGYVMRSRDLVEVAVYLATLGIQRVVGIAIPEADVVFYAHWWALTLVLVGWWRGAGQRLTHAIAAMAVLTVGVGGQALVSGGYQLLFLAEHLGLLVAGVVYRRQWAVWWGIAASVLAVLYFLRAYTFLWLGFLGLVLIAIVVWRLGRTSRQPQ